jgi:orotate phosphoribosyltransferase
MSDDILRNLPARRGHFLLESGYHTDLWFNLDALFVSPEKITPQVAALADLLRPFEVSAVCGPLLGGAFLAQAVATRLGLNFYFTEPAPLNTNPEGELSELLSFPSLPSLFAAEYRLPADLRRQVRGERIAIVDDIISAGSSVRATTTELEAAGASTVVVGALVILGSEAVEHFSARGVPLVAVTRADFNLWTPSDCPLCRTGERLENPVTATYVS